MTARFMAGARVFLVLARIGRQVRGDYRYGEAGGHAVEVIRMLTHGHDLGDDRFAGPIHAKNLGELFEILRGGLSY